MTPFQQSRFWFRRSSTGEKSIATVAIAVFVIVLGYLVWPVHQHSVTVGFGTVGSSSGSGSPGLGGSSGSTSGGSTSGGRNSTNSGLAPNGSGSSIGGSNIGAGSNIGGGSGSSASNTGGSRTGGGVTGGKVTTTTTSQSQSQCPNGVSSTPIPIAIAIVDAGGASGNSALGVPTPAVQQAQWQMVGDSINASGGAGCHKLGLTFYNVDPVDPNQAQQSCLTIASAHPFMVLDVGALTQPGDASCIPQAHIPLISNYSTEAQIQQYYPYWISPADVDNDTFPTGINGLNKDGYYSAAKGFTKLGFLYQDCRKDAVSAMTSAFQKVGISGSKLVTFDLGCPIAGGVSSPSTIEQAVLTFQQAHVSAVTEYTAGLDFNNFTKTAGSQGFKPRYLLEDGALGSGGNSASGPDPTNLNGAINATPSRYGEESTPGYKPSAGTGRCNAIYAAKGMAPVYQQPDGFGGVICDYMWFVQQDLDHAQLQRSDVIAGMQGIGSLDLSYPFGPVSYATSTGQGSGHGLDYWHLTEYYSSCSCWRVLESTFNPPS